MPSRRDGIVFERAYSHSVQTLPAHVALLSGRLPFDTGVRDEGAPIKANERLLAQMLRDRGYATGGIVSSGMLRGETGLARGFDFFDDPSTRSGSPLAPARPEDVPAAATELTAGELRRDGAESEAVAERWLASVGSTRLFLFLQLHEPHAPYAAPERFGALAPYDGAIAYADEIVGRLVRYLKTIQLYDQSTIVLVSDHGEGLGDHGEQGHGLFLYDEAIHVPLIVKQAGAADAGRRVPDLVQQADIVPTVLDLVKAPVPGNLRGRSLKTLADGTGKRPPEQTVYAETRYGRNRFGWSALESLTDGTLQYIKAPREELYDLKADPRQRDNIAEGQVVVEERRTALKRLLGEANEARDDAVTLTDPKDKREVVDQYRSARGLVAERKWPQAIDIFQKILHDEPAAARIWGELGDVAMLAGRYAAALDAYQRVITLEPIGTAGYLGAASASLKARRLEDAQQHAEQAVEAAGVDAHRLAEAHALVATIALARHDADAAKREAALVRESDPGSVWPVYVEARLLYDEGYYADALPLLERANAELRKVARRRDTGPALRDRRRATPVPAVRRGRNAAAGGTAQLPAQHTRERRAGVALSGHGPARERRTGGVGPDARHAHARLVRAGRPAVDVARRPQTGRPGPRRGPAHVHEPPYGSLNEEWSMPNEERGMTRLILHCSFFIVHSHRFPFARSLRSALNCGLTLKPAFSASVSSWSASSKRLVCM